MKNVFISGGAGFIGSHLCYRLKQQGVPTITVFDNFTSGNRAHEQLLKRLGVQVVEQDISNLDEVCRSMDGADTIFHLAANPDIAKAVTHPDIDFWQGTLLAQNIFEAARRTGAGRIFYTSGSGVYGEAKGVTFSEDYGRMRPISTYGASKLGCEALLCAYTHMFGLVGKAFRFANVVGPRQTHGVGFDFLRRLRADSSRLRILGDGTQSKSYIHVDDVLDAIMHVAAHCKASYDVYNVATGDYITVSEIADLAVQVAQLQPGEVRYEFTGGDRGWKGDVPSVLFDCRKISALGWSCKHRSREAIKRAMEAMWHEPAGA
jgi:UDP-glucose 4-epimerase